MNSGQTSWNQDRTRTKQVERTRTKSEQGRAQTSMIEGMQDLGPVHGAQREEEKGKEEEEREGEGR